MRIENDTIGQLELQDDAYYGLQTLRARQNFNITGTRILPGFNRSLAEIKIASATVNGEIGVLAADKASAIIAAAQEAQEKNNARISELKTPKAKDEPEEPIVEPVEEKFVHVCTLRYCPKCGAQVRTDAQFCQACGEKL